MGRACLCGLLAAAAAVVALARTVVPLPNLPVEVHSFNDIDSWPQVLLKGVRWIKLDFSFCTLQSCQQFSTFGEAGRGNTSDCFSVNGTQYCCICMRGDVSARPNLENPFNTSYDFVAFLANPDNAHLLPRANSERKFMLGLDWGGPLDPAYDAVYAWLFALNDTIVTRGLGVVPYFDAVISGWFNDLDRLCYAGKCSPLQRRLSTLPFPSEAGNSLPPQSTDPYNRYAILNSDVSTFNTSCATASWNASLAKADRYPYLWYEPSSQADYGSLLTSWMQCATVPADHRSVNTGVVVVSNQASEMFETLASPWIGRGLNALFIADAVSAPRLLVIDSDASAPVDRWLVIAYFNATASSAFLRVVGYVDGTQPSLARTTDVLPLPAQLQDVASLAAWGTQVLVSSPSGAFAVYALSAVDGTLALGTAGSLGIPPGSALLAAQLFACAGSGCLVAAVNASAQSAAMDVTCFAAASPASPLAVTRVQSGVRVDQGASITLLATGAAAYQGLIAFAASDASNRSLLYTTYIQVNGSVAAGLRVGTEYYGATSGAPPNRMGFGRRPHVASTLFNGQALVLETHQDGSCQCGYIMNNADFSHCLVPSPAMDNNSFYVTYQQVPYLLNFNYGTLDAFRAAVSTPGSSYSMCDPRIMSGKFDSGQSITGALMSQTVLRPNSSVPREEVAMLALFDGNVSQPLVTNLVCGASIPKAGLVLDQFHLVQPDLLGRE